MASARDGTVLEEIVAMKLVTPDEARTVRRIGRETERAGLPMSAGEILVRRGSMDEETCRRFFPLAPPSPSPSDPQLDREAERKALETGAISRPDLESVRAFQSWAEGCGVRIGLSEILVRRGFLPAAPAPPMALARTGRTSRRPRTSRTRSVQRGTGSSSTRSIMILVAGIALGAVLLLVAAIVIFSSGPDVEEPERLPISAGRSLEEPPRSATEPERARNLDAEMAELRRRVAEHLRQRRFDRARREIESAREAMPDEATRTANAALLDELLDRVADEETNPAQREPTPPAAEGPGSRPVPAAPPPQAVGEMRRFEEALRAGRDDEALRILDGMIEADPKSLALHARRGDLLRARRDFPGACASFTRAIELAESLGGSQSFVAGCLHGRGQAYEELYDFEPAKRDFAKAIEIDPQDGFPVYLLGRVHRKCGQPDEAMEIFLSVRGRRLKSETALLLNVEQAFTLVDSGKRDVALQLCAEAVKTTSDPSGVRAFDACRAWSYIHPSLATVDVTEAERILGLGVEREITGGNYPYFLIVLGAIQQVRGNTPGALTLFEASPGMWRMIPESGFYYALALRAAGRTEDAAEVRTLLEKSRPELARRLD